LESHTAQGLERAATAVCGLVPLVGLLFFGWNVLTVIFMLWLDAYLASLRLIPAIWYWVTQILLEGKLREAELAMPGLAGRFGLTLFMFAFCFGLGGFAWGMLTLPISLTYLYLNILDSQFHQGGLEAVAYDLLFDAPWLIALLAGSRLFQCVRAFVAMRAAGPKRFGEVLKAQYGTLFCKSVTLFALGAVATLFGMRDSRSETAFVVAAIIGLVAIEWYADYWFRRAQPTDSAYALKKKLEVIHGFDGRNERL
jgi:hypothetical protein